MSKDDDYSFLNNIDNKVAVIMFLLAAGLTIGAVVLNIVAADECTVNKYVYCEPKADQGHNPH